MCENAEVKIAVERRRKKLGDKMWKMNIHYGVYGLYVCKRTTAQYSMETFH